MIENKDNRIQRLSYILTQLSYGEKLSTIKLAEQFETTTRKIQLDFKEYILPLFDNEMIYYDYSIKCYLSKVNFLQKTFLSSEELAIISILKAKSKDKYSDDNLSLKTNLLFDKFEDSLKNSIYENLSMESIENNKIEIIQIRNAIKSKNEIECIYNDKPRNLYPLKILNLNSFWYLINYDLEYEEIRRYHLNSIKNIEILENEFEFDEEIIKGFNNAINAYFEPHIAPFVVELFLDKKVSRYFLRKPINKTQRILKTYEDDSCDIEIYITDFMEIIPIIQSYLPYIMVVSPEDLSDVVKGNLDEYFRRIK
jgi:predicted DNA-binding transcriptional regulator YafY